MSESARPPGSHPSHRRASLVCLAAQEEEISVALRAEFDAFHNFLTVRFFGEGVAVMEGRQGGGERGEAEHAHAGAKGRGPAPACKKRTSWLLGQAGCLPALSCEGSRRPRAASLQPLHICVCLCCPSCAGAQSEPIRQDTALKYADHMRWVFAQRCRLQSPCLSFCLFMC